MPQKVIWVIDPYSGVPGDGFRSGRFDAVCRSLANENTLVYLIISNFSYRTKNFIAKGLEVRAISANYKVAIIPTSDYQQHISIKRIQYEKRFIKNLFANKAALLAPDVIISKEPAIFMAKGIGKLKAYFKAKLVYDIIDIWPELFDYKLRERIGKLGYLLFYPFYKYRDLYFRKADAFVAVTSDYLDIVPMSLKKPKQVAYWGVPENYGSKSNASRAEILQRMGVQADADTLIGIYAGTLSDNYDIDTLLEGYQKLAAAGTNIHLIIAGSGPKSDWVKTFSQTAKNITYIGMVDAQLLGEILSHCDFGYLTYSGFSTVSLPIKFYDYLYFGLPMISSLGRECKALINSHNLGSEYKAGNSDSLFQATLQMAADREALANQAANCLKIRGQFFNEVQYAKYAEFVSGIINN